MEDYPLLGGVLKSLMFLWKELLLDMRSWCRTGAPNIDNLLSDFYISKDFDYLCRRVNDEGSSFLTITLPRLSEVLQKGLSDGQVSHHQFSGWKCPKNCEFPEFLQGFHGLIFDRATGLLLDEPDSNAIYAIRQLTLFFGKILLPCSDAREKAAFDQFIKCENDIKITDKSLDRSSIDRAVRISNLLYADILSVIDHKIHNFDLIPKHGPGSTADKISGNQKFRFSSWPRRLDSIFPLIEYSIPSYSHWEYAQSINIIEPGAELPVRVISVPKTLKTPRIIAIEPTVMQFAQQGLKDALVSEISSDAVISQMIGFDDQTPNQSLALQSSVDQSLATIDLSEASDRVSNQLVRELFRQFPHFSEFLDASRSRKADVPGYGVKRLSKFASMGSAMTFPIEAMVFLTIIFVGIESQLSRPLTRKDIISLLGRVRVYGDDIIIPVEYVQTVNKALDEFGFVVNLHKSFWSGKFRESCGKEYYDGHDVSITRVRRLLPNSRHDVPELVSTVSLRNNLYASGCWNAARYLDNFLKRIIPFPTVADTSPALGRWSFLGYETQRLHPSLFSPLVKAWTTSSTPRSSVINGVPALLKCLSKQSDEPFIDRKHLERHGRPETVDIKLRWVSSY